MVCFLSDAAPKEKTRRSQRRTRSKIKTEHTSVMLVPDKIQRDGMDVNSTNNIVCVGQQINLTNIVLGSATNAVVTSYQWTIPGANNTPNDTAFRDYEPNYTNSCYTNLFTPTNYTTNAYCNFYWSAGGTNTVTCRQVIYGQTNTVSATFNVSSPTAAISASTNGPIAVGSNYGGPAGEWLYFGENIGTNNGVSFSQTNAPAPGGFTGQFRYVQTASVAITNSSAYNPNSVTSPSGTNVDTTFPYDYPNSAGIIAYDSPADPYLVGTNQTTTEKFHATMYLFWQAYSTNSVVNGDKTIYVPLRGVNWSWSATATNTSGTWALQGNASYPTNLNDFPVTNEVQWSNNATNFIIVP